MDCQGCGLPNPTGARWHRDCWRAEIGLRALQATAVDDAMLLQMMANGMSRERMAGALGVSRERVRQRLAGARRRSAARTERGL